jgi:hypothetical protein
MTQRPKITNFTFFISELTQTFLDFHIISITFIIIQINKSLQNFLFFFFLTFHTKHLYFFFFLNINEI